MPIVRLGDLDKARGSDDGPGGKNPKEKKKTSSYTGGERSGLAVENPTNDEDDDNSAMDDDENNAFSKAEKATGPMPPGARKVTLYRNGFRVDDGPFRPLSDPANEKFVNELKRGYAPAEMMEGADGPVHIGLEDKRSEDYRPPPGAPPIDLFAGEGRSLGGSGTSSAAPTKDVDLSAGKIQVDPAKPTTTLQIRFHDGQKKSEVFNQDATIQELHNYLQQVAPLDGPYSLVEGFPPKPVPSDASLTLKEAKLLTTTLTQRRQ